MKTVTVYCDKDLVLRYVEKMPEEPRKDRIYNDSLTMPGSYGYAIEQYQSALQSVKASSIPFEDQDKIIYQTLDWYAGRFTKDDLKPDTFYTIELNGEVEIVEILGPGWVPTYNDPDNSSGHPNAEPIQIARLKPELNSISEEKQPIRLKDMALSYDAFLCIKNNTINNGTVLADKLHRPKDEIQADFFHSKETAEKICETRAVDLTIRLLRSGVRVIFKDGEVSEKIIANVSPPLYDKYFSEEQEEKSESQEEFLNELENHILVNEHDWNRNPQAMFKDFKKSLTRKGNTL